MAHKTFEAAKRVYYMQRPNRWQNGIGAALPEAYKKFWREWKLQKPAPVHYIKEEGLFKRDETTGKIFRVQNIPIPLKFPKEFDDMLLGGEGIIAGFRQKSRFMRRVPTFWVPEFKKTVVYSEVLDKYMRVTATNRAILLIHENYGFDHYLLKTAACDLKSQLALKLKQRILTALADKTLYPDDPQKREEVYAKYQHYLSDYTREEIEWYGLTWEEAIKKYVFAQEALKQPVPLKIQFRADYIEDLKKEVQEETKKVTMGQYLLSKVNPFSESKTK